MSVRALISISRIAVYSSTLFICDSIRTEPRPKTAAAGRTHFVPNLRERGTRSGAT